MSPNARTLITQPSGWLALALFLAIVPGSTIAAAQQALGGTAWRVLSFPSTGDEPPVRPAPPRPRSDSPQSQFLPPPDELSGGTFTMAFGRDGRVTVISNCNRASGNWTSTGDGQLHFGPLSRTLAMCPPPATQFLDDFQYMNSYAIEGDTLRVMLTGERGSYRFVPLK